MKAHRTDGVSLTFGLIFLAIAAWWLLARRLDLPLPVTGWLLAGALILFGLFGLLGALRGGAGPNRTAGPARPDQADVVDPPNPSADGPPVHPVTAPPAPPDETRR